jgi:phosphoglycolate phosphatase
MLYIGDELRDVIAAVTWGASQKAGIPIAAVTWGFNSPESLAARIRRNTCSTTRRISCGCFCQNVTEV